MTFFLKKMQAPVIEFILEIFAGSTYNFTRKYFFYKYFSMIFNRTFQNTYILGKKTGTGFFVLSGSFTVSQMHCKKFFCISLQKKFFCLYFDLEGIQKVYSNILMKCQQLSGGLSICHRKSKISFLIKTFTSVPLTNRCPKLVFIFSQKPKMNVLLVMIRLHYRNLYPFLPNIPFLYPLKTSENSGFLMFSVGLKSDY